MVSINSINKFVFFKSKRVIVFIFFIIILIINLSIHFSKYLDLTYEEIYKDEAQVINLYEKEKFNILKLKTSNYNFYTSVSKDISLKKLDYVFVIFISKYITFFDYLKDFYAKNIDIEKLEKNSFKQKLSQAIEKEHDNKNISSLFNALFLAIPVNKDLREIFTNYSISHLIALSGFHIALMSSILYFVFYYPYNFIHQMYFPYRNKKSYLTIFVLFLIFLYLVFTGFIPSLLRAFVMAIFAFYILRSNIKLISFENLAMTFLFIIPFFPKYFFSIGFWFSVSAVFYIFLYIKYFKNINKYLHLFLFNFWMFFIFNPIVHYFFPQTSYEQLLSAFITIGFVFFYPFEIILHFIGYGSLLDLYILKFFMIPIEVYMKSTAIWFFIFYVLVSFFSIFSKKIFYILNFIMIIFNLYLYVL